MFLDERILAVHVSLDVVRMRGSQPLLP